jgi:hypothetical protein
MITVIFHEIIWTYLMFFIYVFMSLCSLLILYLVPVTSLHLKNTFVQQRLFLLFLEKFSKKYLQIIGKKLRRSFENIFGNYNLNIGRSQFHICMYFVFSLGLMIYVPSDSPNTFIFFLFIFVTILVSSFCHRVTFKWESVSLLKFKKKLFLWFLENFPKNVPSKLQKKKCQTVKFSQLSQFYVVLIWH